MDSDWLANKLKARQPGSPLSGKMRDPGNEVEGKIMIYPVDSVIQPVKQSKPVEV